MLTDTHCHLDSEAFDADRPAVIERALNAGLGRLLAPGLNLESSRRCIELSAANSPLYSAVGIHPTEAETTPVNGLDALRRLAKEPKVVAIGEIGLDYYWVHDRDQQARQREMLREQLRLAGELHKPVIIHFREEADAGHGPCAEDLLEILERWAGELRQATPGGPAPGVLHSFSGSLQTARRAMELGFYIGVTGPITYKNASSRREVIGALPLERLLIETDSPYLAPQPHRGKRNEPAYVTHIADKIASMRNLAPEEIAAVTAANADRLFSWGDSA